MTQTELEKQVADSTGEDIDTVQRMGFGPLVSIAIEEREPLTVDWDLLDTSR